jgi:catechol 2,3-dioxygenase
VVGERRPDVFGVVPPDYRLPPSTCVGPVTLQVSDLDHSIGYYERVLGLRVLDRAGPDAALGPHDEPSVLVRLHARSGLRRLSRRSALGLYHFALRLPDRPALGRFIGHIQTAGLAVGTADHAVSESLYLTDPDGLGIEVYADRPRSSWRMQGGSLAMAIDPLDLEDLVRAAGGQPWSGAPPGTRMGHVHLHVGDLESASAFYHTALGLDRIVLSIPGALFMSAGGYHHHLGTNIWAAGAPAATEGDARLLEWTIQLPKRSDMEGAVRSLAASGHEVRQDSGDALAADPWGTNVRLVAR